MEPNYPERTAERKSLRAIVEISGGEIFVFPVADSDLEQAEILDVLRVYCGETEGRRGE